MPSGSNRSAMTDPNTVPAATAQQVLSYLTRQLVDDPDAVSVEAEEGAGRTVLNVMERYVRPAPWPGLVGFGQQASMARRILDIAGYRSASRRSRPW